MPCSMFRIRIEQLLSALSSLPNLLLSKALLVALLLFFIGARNLFVRGCLAAFRLFGFDSLFGQRSTTQRRI